MGKKILVVDDSATVRQQVRVVLQQAGFEILEADNGAIGLTMAKSHAVDLIVADVNMPVMNGLEMVAEIRRMPQYVKTPIFVLTTESSGEIVQQGKAVGATAWIVKPFNAAKLLGGVKKVLGVA